MVQCCNRSAAVINIFSASLVALFLSACAAGPTRLDPSRFFLVQEGRVPPTSSQAFADCLLDGFDKAHFMFTNVTSRQQRRYDSYRVESLAGGSLLIVSADVFDDGRVQLLEAKAGALINTSGERDAFGRCLNQYGTAQR